MAVKFSNNAQSTLTANIAAGVTTLPIVSSSTFPTITSDDWVYVSISNEVIKVTSIASTSLTCVATSAAHTSGTSVEIRVSSEMLTDIADNTTIANNAAVAMSIALG
jgi:hypothetical protein|tara:strand:- start:119 stop:439 length:321 start_codon:yes stop_codon:yes gene_type:complete